MWGEIYNELQTHVWMHVSKRRALLIRSVTSRLQMSLNMYANNELRCLSSSALRSRVRRPPEGGEHSRRLATLLHAQILYRPPENYLVFQVSRRARRERHRTLPPTCSCCCWREQVVQTNKCVKGSTCTEARRGAGMKICVIFSWGRSLVNFQSGKGRQHWRAAARAMMHSGAGGGDMSHTRTHTHTPHSYTRTRK